MAALLNTIHVAYVTASLLALVGVSIILIRSAERIGRRSTATVAVAGLAVWYGAVTVAGINGAFVGRSTDLVAPIAFGLVPPLAIGLIALWRSESLARIVADAAASLISVQAYRMVGGGFLVLMALGTLPAVFALPAGIGDLLIGLTAGRVADRVGGGDRSAGLAWNALGVLDLVVAVGLGLVAAPGVAQLIVTVPTTAAVTLAPLVVVPAFLVPLSLLLHAASLRTLLASDVRTAATPDRKAA
jgi:hypothetical protein